MPYLVNAVKFTEQGDKELLELTGELEAELHPLADAILALSSGEPSRAAPPSFDKAASEAALQQLETLLVQDNFAAHELMHGSAPLFSAALGEAADMLTQQIGSFDYEAALLTLRASRNSDTTGP